MRRSKLNLTHHLTPLTQTLNIMINVQELRIGNLFWDVDKTPCYYAGSWEREDGWINRDSAGNTYKELEMYPIPLTPELLEKVGFEKAKEAWPFIKLPYEESGADSKLFMSKSHLGYIVGIETFSEQGVDCFDIRDLTIGINREDHPNGIGFVPKKSMNFFKPISSLHQLQNLYFALTQTELPTQTLK